jgi:hypothetical protein
MPHYNTVMSQMLNLIPRHEFDHIVRTHDGDRNVKKFSCYQHLVVMLFAQLRGLDSLREIETALGAYSNRWYHLGLKSVKRSTIAEANGTRPWEIYREFFYRLLERCRSFNPKHRFKVPNPIVSIDATTIQLCLGLFPWSNYHNTKGAIKLHYRLDYAGYLPARIVVTDARGSELKLARQGAFELEPDSIVLMDRGFGDYQWFQELTSQGVWFIIRGRRNIHYAVAGQHPLPENSSVLSDSTIRFKGYKAQKDYPGPLRLITVIDAKTGDTMPIVTNNFLLDAQTLADLYKARWQIEIFFKWIKQHLKIKSFLGTSKNAVLTQIWVAMCAYLLLSYIKFQSRCTHGLLELSRLIRETLLSPFCLIDLLRISADELPKTRSPDPQLELFA